MQQLEARAEKAQRAYEHFLATDNQLGNGRFLGGGNTGKAFRGRHNAAVDKRNSLSQRAAIRRLLADFATHDKKWPNWQQMRQWMYKASIYKYGRDATDYAALDTLDGTVPLGRYHAAISTFIQEHGTATDQRLLLPLFN